MFERWFIHHKFPKNINTTPSNWKKLPLKDFVTFKKGKKLAGDAIDNGLYPFFTGSKETQKINEYSFDQEALILIADGARHIKYFSGKFNTTGHVYVLDASHKYISWLLEIIKYSIPIFDRISRGTGITGLCLGDLRNFEVPLPPDNLLDLFNKFAEPIQKQIDILSRQMNTFQIIKQELVERIYSENLEINF
ncbi:hypothetical protein A6V39_01815 [Candidatus Mycoplasma haematobovis]|uniref:Type I restriction modification DNA specificity domain-containing protein n=1 Tax=Candidatus Mycoplasma haematobovis TaxID=432608 RepID=A0A1A9QGC8_9MOLU|nr:restriction endonuclease subunit S [Candidatus Mycoplasma haematobovis]OAL10780.1 hypothetical protein A6V39_01815 [Candidatus Mycoplasma haematobovis]